MEFLNRKKELDKLEQTFEQGGFLPIYGRRRVGKTTLIQQFIKNKDSVYYLAAQEPVNQQVKEFKNLMADHINDEFLRNSDISNWKSLFTYLKQNMDAERKSCIVIDEVTFIIRKNDSFPSYLQKFWDNFLKDSNTSLVLSGSLIGLMKESILSQSSPVYGRRTGQINLKPLSIEHLAKLFDTSKQSIKLYSILGGIPKYYEEVDYNKEFPEVINQMLDPESFFFEEGIFLLSQEFKELGNYNAILQSISKGNHRATKIANDIGMETRQIYTYLDKIYEIGLIEEKRPITEKNTKSRNKRYYLEDNFTRFWYKIIFPERSRIQSEEVKYKNIKKQLKHLISQSFKEISRETIRKTGNYQKVGRWWCKEDEIDIVALNEEKEEILFGECKWTETKVGTELLTKLEEKSQKVRWQNQKTRTEKYSLFSKNGFTEKMREKTEERKDITLYNLEKIRKTLQ